MQRRLLVAFLTLTLLASAVGAAVLIRSPNQVRLSDDPAEASHVTLYQNGLAVVRLMKEFETTGGITTLVVALPPTTVYESILIEGDGVSVREVRSALAQTAGIHPGSTVVVHLHEALTYRGTVHAIEGGQLVLTSATGLTYIDMSKVSAVEVEGPVADGTTTPGYIEVAIVVDAPAGAHNVTLSYLTQGSGWTPSYRLDTGTGALTFFATLVAPEDWKDVGLDLVSGQPNLVYTPVVDTYLRIQNEAMAGYAAAASFDKSFGPSTPLGDLHRYRYDGTLSVARGETVRLVLDEGELDILRRYHEARAAAGGYGAAGDSMPVSVLEKIEFRNALDDPLPPGTVHLYRDGEWIGSDMMPTTPAGERGNLTVSTPMDVTARLLLVDHESTATLDRWTYHLSVTNGFVGAAAKTIDLRAVIDHNSYRTSVIETTEGAQRTGSSAAWDRPVEPGATASFALAFETLRYG